MAVNPLQMILAEPVTAFQRGREAGAMARQRERMEAEQNRALEQRNRLQELYSGITPESDPEAIARQAGMIGGMESEQQFRQYFGQRDQAKQAQVQARNEGVARIIAEIDRLPPEQQDTAYQQFATRLPEEWRGLPYAQARGRAIALITPVDKLFAQSTAKVPTSIQEFQYAQQNPRYMQYRTQIAQAGARPQYGMINDTPIVYGPDGYSPVPRSGSARPGVTTNPVVDAVSQLFPGVQVTSGTRTPERNKEVGGVDNSYHVRGQAADIVPQSPQQAQQIRQWAAQNGMEVIDYQDGHLHIEPAPGSAAPQIAPEGSNLRGTIFELDAPPIEASSKLKGVWAGLTPEQRKEAVEIEAGVRAAPAKPAAGKPPTDSQLAAAAYLGRMNEAEALMNETLGKGYTPGGIRDFLTAGQGPVRNYLATEQGQLYRQAQEDWVRAKLRKESGAVIGDDEMEREIKVYFPQPGDSASVIKQKEAARMSALRQMRTMSGRASPAGGSEGEDIDALVNEFLGK